MTTDTDIVWHQLGDAELRALADAATRVLGGHAWVRACWLFGSAARRNRPARDIDLGILARPIPDWREPIRLAAELADASGIHAIPFDVRLLNAGDPVFLNNVLKDGMLLYEADREARIDFEVRAMSLWLDFKPTWERLRAQALARWAHG